MRKKKEIQASFAAVPQTAKVMAIVHDIYLVKMKKALNLHNKIFVCLFSFTFISWRLITLQYCSGFCHTLT